MADLDALLIKTSRTFALAIPFLPEPTRREVTIAYLLLRIGDTFEDATGWVPQQKISALMEFNSLVHTGLRGDVAGFAQRLKADPPGASATDLELLGETGAVLEALDAVGPRSREV